MKLQANKTRRLFEDKTGLVLWSIIVILFVVLAISSDVFLSTRNFQSMALQIAPLGLLSLGMMFALVSGGINLGLVATGNLSCIIMAIIYKNILQFENVGPVGVLITASLVCLFSGLLTMTIGALIGYLSVPPILAGLAVQKFADGVSLILTRGTAYSRFPENLRAIDVHLIGGVPAGLFVMVVLTGLVSVMFNKKILGAKIFMVGSNNLASEYCGISVKHTLLWTYFMSGLLAGFGCFLMTMQFEAVNVGQGDSFILKTVLICVLGGVSPVGGYGRVYGVVLALTILQLVSSGLNILGLVSYVQTSLWGIVVLAVVAVQRYNDYRSQRKLAQRQST